MNTRHVRINEENTYKCANILFFHDNEKKPYLNNQFPGQTVINFLNEGWKDYSHTTIAFQLIRDLYWVQVNGGPIDGLDKEFGKKLLIDLNALAGKNARYIMNPFNDQNYAHFHHIKVNRWFILGPIIKTDW